MTGDFESRLHRAAGSLRRSVADVPAGEPRRPHSTGSAVLGVGVGVAVGALVLTAFATWRDGGGNDDLAMQPVADVQALVASHLPGGLEVAWAGQQRGGAAAGSGQAGGQVASSPSPSSAAGGGSVDTYLYGAASDGTDRGAAPFATSDLVVDVRRGPAPEVATGAGAGAGPGAAGSGQPVTVRGRTGQLATGPGLTVLRWTEAETAETATETETTEVVAASRVLTPAQLVAVADGLTIEDEVVTLGALPPDLPGPLSEVGHVARETTGSGADQANWVGYVDPADPRGRVVDVTTRTGGPAELLALAWQLDADQPVDVRGREAWLAASAPGVDPATADAAQAGPVLDLVWQEESGVLVHVTSLGLSEPEVRQVADGLHPASDQEWDEIETTVAAVATAGESDGAATAGAGDGSGPDAPGDGTTGPGGTGAGDSGGATTSATGSAGGAGADAGTGTAGRGETGELDEIEAQIHDDLGVGTVIDLVDGLAGGLRDALGGATGTGGPPPTSPSTSASADPASGSAESDAPAVLESAP